FAFPSRFKSQSSASPRLGFHQHEKCWRLRAVIQACDTPEDQGPRLPPAAVLLVALPGNGVAPRKKANVAPTLQRGSCRCGRRRAGGFTRRQRQSRGRATARSEDSQKRDEDGGTADARAEHATHSSL